MAKEEKWISFVEDINRSLRLAPPFTTASEEQAIQDIMERQKGDDAFVDEDYVPGNSIGLRDSTVAWLIENEIPVPDTWETRLKKQAEKAKKTKEDEKMKKNDKKETKTAPVKETKKVEKPAKENKEEKVKTKKAGPPRGNAPKSPLGHMEGSTAAKIDEMFLKGTSEKEFEKAGISLSRVKSHYKHIIKKRSDIATITFKDGVYKAVLKKG